MNFGPDLNWHPQTCTITLLFPNLPLVFIPIPFSSSFSSLLTKQVIDKKFIGLNSRVLYINFGSKLTDLVLRKVPSLTRSFYECRSKKKDVHVLFVELISQLFFLYFSILILSKLSKISRFKYNSYF